MESPITTTAARSRTRQTGRLREGAGAFIRGRFYVSGQRQTWGYHEPAMTEQAEARAMAAFRARVVVAILLLAGGGWWAWRIVFASSTGPAAGFRNLLLVTLDTTRADRLGCYGHAGAATPVLDGLAASGVLFEKCMTAAPFTLPGHATILTGLLPPRHGLRVNGARGLPESVDTLAEVLVREAPRRSRQRIGPPVSSASDGNRMTSTKPATWTFLVATWRKKRT